MQAESRLKNFPVSFFSVVMGLAGFCIAWEKATSAMGMHSTLPSYLAGATMLVFLVLAGFYTLKILKYRAEVVAELQHPVKLNFFSSISISLILLSITALPINLLFSKLLWLAGTSLQLALLLFIMNTWMHHERFRIDHMNPAWFIPAVGNVLVPLSGMEHGFVEVSWFFFSVGLLFWLVLLSIIFNRILFHQPLPDKLMPTLFILIAPPALGFSAYVKLTGTFDAFAHVLYYIALFFTLLLFTQIARFARLPFFLSWWAYSFPLASVTVASWVMFENTGVPGVRIIAIVLLAIMSLVVALLLFKTLTAIFRDKVCVPD